MEEVTRKTYKKHASTYEKRWSGYLKATHQQALHATTLPKNPCVLDLSGGTGLFSKQLHQLHPDAHIDLLDASKEMLEVARKRFNNTKNVTIQEADAKNIPADNNTYDAIYCLSALQHYTNPQEVLQEARRTLKEHGTLILVAWTKTTWWSKLVYALLQLHPAHHTIPTINQLHRLLTQAHLHVTKQQPSNYRYWGLTTTTATKNLNTPNKK